MSDKNYSNLIDINNDAVVSSEKQITMIERAVSSESTSSFLKR